MPQKGQGVIDQLRLMDFSWVLTTAAVSHFTVTKGNRMSCALGYALV